jgi:hypothetical protein
MSKALKKRASQVVLAAALPPDRCCPPLRGLSGSLDLALHLPFLRRYASALTRSHSSGDAYVRAALSAFLAGDQGLVDQASSRVGLYRLFHAIWATASARFCEDDDRADGTGPRSPGGCKRAVLLLTSMEAFSPDEVAFITAQPTKTVRRIVGDTARAPTIYPNISAQPPSPTREQQRNV